MLKSNKEIDDAFYKIDEEFDKVQKKNKYLKYSLMNPIHEKFPYAQNGITAMIAKMSSGKSYNYLKLMRKQEELFDDAVYELIVICSTSGKFDATTEAFQKLVKKSKVVHVKDSDLLDYLNKLMRRTLKFNELNKFMDSATKSTSRSSATKSTSQSSDEMKRISEKHGLKLESKNVKDVSKVVKYITNKIEKYGWRTFPHRTLLILDDFASHPLLRSKENELSRLLKKLRHFYISVIICVQTTRSIPRDLKRILTDVMIFPGISKDDFYDLFKESVLGSFDVDSCYKAYKALTNAHDTMTFHVNANRIIVNLAKK